MKFAFSRYKGNFISSKKPRPNFAFSKLCYCNDISALFQSINIIHDLANWRLFIDSCKESIKAVLLQNRNCYIHLCQQHIQPASRKHTTTFADEHDERLHQDIAVIEKMFKEKWSTGMLAEYCWSLNQDKPEQGHKKWQRWSSDQFLRCFWIAPF